MEIGHAEAVLGGDRHRLAETEREGLVIAGVGSATLRLVGDEDQRLAGGTDQRGEMLIQRRDAGAGIDHEQDEIGLVDCRFGLGAHAAGQGFGVDILQAGGIDEADAQIADLRLAQATVPGNARPVVDQRQAAADHTVEQRRLADIGPADNGNGDGHRWPLTILPPVSAKPTGCRRQPAHRAGRPPPSAL